MEKSAKLDALKVDVKVLDIDAMTAEEFLENPPAPGVSEHHAREEFIASIEEDIMKEYSGSALVLHNVKLLHARWNESKYTLEFPPRFETRSSIQVGLFRYY